MNTPNVINELRSALNATSNGGGVDPGFNAVEITAKINGVIQDLSPKFSEIRNMIPRQSMDQATHIWSARISDNTSTKFGYTYSEQAVSGTNTGTPAHGAKVQLTATAVSFRSDWEVENYFKYASRGFYDAVADEVNNTLRTHTDKEERQIVVGNDVGAGGIAEGFLGLKQIVNSFVTVGDTTTIYNITRASGKTYMDAQVVNAAGAAFDISMLDKARTKLKRRQAKPGFFVMSYERQDELNLQLQVQQRFQGGTLAIAGGFTVPTYLGIPVIGSVYADKLGASDTDTAILLIAADNLVMKTLRETENVNVDLGRFDAVGGFLVTYEVLVSPRLTDNCLIHNIAVPNV
jgi:hypothetical protein